MKRKLLFALAFTCVTSPVSADQVLVDDHIVTGSQCVGLDCANGENFGFNTIVLKENNLRILFADTSVSAQFPTTDWMLVANDSTNGGRSRFSIEDATHQTEPLTVMAGAPTGSVHVAENGAVGIGTAIPVRTVHMSASDTPTLRMHQTPSVGWPEYAWDLGINESNLFVRDVNTGALPMRILSGAGDNSLVVTGSGLTVTSNGIVQNSYEDAAANATWTETYTAGSWTMGDGSTDAIVVSSSGNVTIAGTLSQSSSRSIKHRITPVKSGEVLERARSIGIARWRYKNDQTQAEHMGPMAEDFRAAFGLGADDQHLASSDVAAVALASMQALSRVVEQQATELRRLTRENKQLAERLARIESHLHR